MRVAEHVAAVFPRTAAFEGGRLVAVGGVAVDELARRFGTPLYVVDRAELVGRMRAYREAFGADNHVAYGAKALCVVGILQLAAAEGLHLDVAALGELHTARRADFPMDRIYLHGNNKSAEELELAARLGVGRIVVDSFEELRRVSDLGRRTGRAIPVLLRVTPGVSTRTHEFIRTGQDDSKFGFTLSAGLAHAAAEQALGGSGVELRGLHCHVGSQIFTADVFDTAVAAMVGLLADLRDRHGVTLPELNLGGGLGVAHRPGERFLSVADYAAAVREGVAAHCARRELEPPRLTVEPGRSIVGPAGITLYTVGTVKEIPGVRTYMSVDGGMSDNPRPSLYGARYEVVAAGSAGGAGSGNGGGSGAGGSGAGEAEAERTRRTTVAGLHCESGDLLAHDIDLPASLAAGQRIAVAATGAYTAAMASNYNRVPRPAIVLVADGRAWELVRRETLDDVVRRDVPLDAAAVGEASDRGAGGDASPDGGVPGEGRPDGSSVSL